MPNWKTSSDYQWISCSADIYFLCSASQNIQVQIRFCMVTKYGKIIPIIKYKFGECSNSVCLGIYFSCKAAKTGTPFSSVHIFLWSQKNRFSVLCYFQGYLIWRNNIINDSFPDLWDKEDSPFYPGSHPLNNKKILIFQALGSNIHIRGHAYGNVEFQAR